MNKQKLTARQATFWFVMYQVGSAYLILPTSIIKIAKQDAWLSALVSLAMNFLLIPLYVAIANQMKGKPLVAYIDTLLGNRAGRCFTFLFIISVPFLIFVLTLRNIGDFISTSIMPETPEEAIYALMLTAVYCVVRAGAAVIGRSAETLFMVIPSLFLFVSILLLPGAEFKHLLPVLEFGWKPIVRASFLLLSFPFLETFLFLFLLSNLGSSDIWKKAVVRSSLFSGFVCVVMLLMVTSVLGQSVASDLTYSSYSVVRSINIGDFIQRFEAAIAINWYISIFFRLALLLYITVHGLGSVFRLQDATSLLIPVMLIALIMAHSIWPNITYLVDFFQIWPLYAMVFGIAVPLVLWLLGRMKQSRSHRKSRI